MHPDVLIARVHFFLRKCRKPGTDTRFPAQFAGNWLSVPGFAPRDTLRLAVSPQKRLSTLVRFVTMSSIPRRGTMLFVIFKSRLQPTCHPWNQSQEKPRTTEELMAMSATGSTPNEIILLGGGDKNTQASDIKKAKECWEDYNA